MSEKYDAIVIGAGMSGIACAIRLGMFDKKVLLLEKHSISGGLNSYYRRKKWNFDVGLHALTNFAAKGEKRKPLLKLLKQLRIPYEALELSPQKSSLIAFPNHKLRFNNEIDYFKQEIAELFPNQIDSFEKLLHHIENFNELDLNTSYASAKDIVKSFIKDESLVEMIFCPLLIYGSAWENDMDFSQFVIMFKSIFLEGFSRPKGGVRTIIDLLLDKAKEANVDIRFREEVIEVINKDGKATGVKTNKGSYAARDIFSSAGLPETLKLTNPANEHEIGKLSFTESIFISSKKPKDFDLNDTIIFYNNRDKYQYKAPEGLYDPMSAVLCFPNNFQDDYDDEGWFRVTNIANYSAWRELERKDYLNKKQDVAQNAYGILNKFAPKLNNDFLFKDIFTPTTITKYTSHFQGTVYGSTDKSKDGTTKYDGLYICGTDQGFLGIVGSILSGISMANLHGLMK